MAMTLRRNVGWTFAYQTSTAIVSVAFLITLLFSAADANAGGIADGDIWHTSDERFCSHVSSFGNAFLKASQEPSTAMAWDSLKARIGSLIAGPSPALLNEYQKRIADGLVCNEYGQVARYSNADPNQIGVKKGGASIDSDGKFMLPGQRQPTPTCDGQVALLIRYANAATQWLDNHDASLRTPNAYVPHDIIVKKSSTVRHSSIDGIVHINNVANNGDNAETCDGIAKSAINAILSILEEYPADQITDTANGPVYGVFFGVPTDSQGTALANGPSTLQSITRPTSVPGTAPLLLISPTFTTTSQIIDITGRVSGQGRNVALQVNGTDTPVNADGTFTVRRGAPIGDSDLQLAATDEWGQTTRATVRVNRTVAASTVTAYAPLDPTKAKGTQRQNSVALIIGIDRYQSVPPADYAENDARSFYDYATNALGVPADRIKLLVGADARRLDVRKAIQTWMKPLIKPGKTDVYVFFSGHGLASEDGKDLYLLPFDGEADLLADSAIRRKDLIDAMSEARAASATFFLDTCYSGSTRSREALVASARPIRIVAKDDGIPSNVTIFAAAANDQLSSSLATVKHGLFSYFLMKGLEGEAAGADHTITAEKLVSYLAIHIPAEAAKMGRKQTPQLAGDNGTVISAW